MQIDEKRYMKLNDLSAYRLAYNFSNLVWDVVVKWDMFAKRTVGMQWVRAADSVSANEISFSRRFILIFPLSYNGRAEHH